MRTSARFEVSGPILSTCPWTPAQQGGVWVAGVCVCGGWGGGGGRAVLAMTVTEARTTWGGSGLKPAGGQHRASAHTSSTLKLRHCLMGKEKEMERMEGAGGGGEGGHGDGLETLGEGCVGLVGGGGGDVFAVGLSHSE